MSGDPILNLRQEIETALDEQDLALARRDEVGLELGSARFDAALMIYRHMPAASLEGAADKLEQALLDLADEEGEHAALAKPVLAEMKARFERGEVAFGDAVALRRLAALRYGRNGGEHVHTWIAHALAGIAGRLTVH